MSFIDPANDGIDVTTFPYDVEALHGRYAKHAYVVDIGATTQLLAIKYTAGTLRTHTCVTNGEQFPGFIKSFGTTSTVARVRIFFD